MALIARDTATYKVLDKNIWTTKHCRYLASSRLKKKSKYSQYTIAVLSIYVLALSIGPKYNFFSDLSSDQANFSNVLLSIAIMALSLLEANNNYEVQGDRLYHCANELAALLVRLNRIGDFTNNIDKDLEDISSEYDKILHKYNENHSELDHEKFIVSRTGASRYSPFWFYLACFKYYVHSFGWYFFLTSAPIIYYLCVYKGLFASPWQMVQGICCK